MFPARITLPDFLGFIGDELAEFSGRHGRRGAQIDVPSLPRLVIPPQRYSPTVCTLALPRRLQTPGPPSMHPEIEPPPRSLFQAARSDYSDKTRSLSPDLKPGTVPIDANPGCRLLGK